MAHPRGFEPLASAFGGSTVKEKITAVMWDYPGLRGIKRDSDSGIYRDYPGYTGTEYVFAAILVPRPQRIA